MRLTPVEQAAIADAARQVLAPGCRVSLFGSRVDDEARGGDIDLLIDTGEPLSAEAWVATRTALIARLYRDLGERRIDVLLSAPPELAPPASILVSARARAIELVRT